MLIKCQENKLLISTCQKPFHNTVFKRDDVHMNTLQLFTSSLQIVKCVLIIKSSSLECIHICLLITHDAVLKVMSL